MDSLPRSSTEAEPHRSSSRQSLAEREQDTANENDGQVIRSEGGRLQHANPLLGVPGEAASSIPKALGEEITLDGAEPFNLRGDFYDFYLGTHVREGKVILKRLRLRGGGSSDDEPLSRDFKAAVDTWMSLPHEHILKCLGIFELRGSLCFVSPFMKNGTLSEWIRSERPAGSERLRLIRELAEAIGFLHANGIVHGDVKAQNVLVSDDLRVKLCEFGLTKIAETRTNTRLKGTGSFRWQSPELWNNEPKTSKSDVYAFSMTIVEILTGEIPFVDLVHDPAVMMAVVGRNERPAKVPETSLDGTSYKIAWSVAEQGWVTDASKRLSMTAAAHLLQRAV